MDGRLLRMSGAGDVPVYIPAGGDGVEVSRIKRGQGRLQVAPEDAVQLDGLSCRDLDGTGSVLAGDVMRGEPLFRAEEAARYPQADHKRPEPFQFLFGAFLPAVAV